MEEWRCCYLLVVEEGNIYIGKTLKDTMSVQNINDRVLVFPEKGKLLVSSDLHGNKSDYLRMLSKWADSQDAGNETYLLFLGDLVHGPAHPDQMTRLQYNHDDSEFIVDHLMAMQKLHPGKFFSLLSL